MASLPRTAFDLLLHNNSPISEHFKSVVANRLAKDMGTEDQVMVDLIERNDRETIRNILVGAAYLASADGGNVTMDHLLHSTRRELQKMGRLVREKDLTNG